MQNMLFILILVWLGYSYSLSGQIPSTTYKRYYELAEDLHTKDADSAIILLEKVLQYDISDSLKAEIFTKQGEIFLFLGDRHRAIEFFYRAKNLWTELGMASHEAASLLNLGISNMKDEQALHKFRESLHLSVFIKDTLLIAKSFNNIGVYYLHHNIYDSAKVYFNYAYELTGKTSSIVLKTSVLINLSVIDFIESRFGESHKKLAESYRILRENNTNTFTHYTLLNTYYKLAEFHHFTDSALQSKRFLDTLLTLSKDNYLTLYRRGLDLKVLQLEVSERFQEALNVKFQADSLKDAINTKNKSDLLALLELDYQNKLDKERASTLQAELANLQSKRTFIIVLLIISIVSSILIFYQIRAKSKKEKELIMERKTQAELKQQLAEKELENARNRELLLASDLEEAMTDMTKYAGNWVKINEMLKDIKKSVSKVQQSAKDERVKETLRELKLRLSQHTHSRLENEALLEKAKSYNASWMREVKTQYPQLKEQDLELIVLLMLGYQAKEIAGMYNVEVQSIYTKRYRVRKKLSISRQQSLTDFFEKEFKYKIKAS